MTTTTNISTRSLRVPGATLVYDVRECPSTTQPPLLLMGSPMAASGFAQLAAHFADRSVVTYDPRGSERSVKDDPTASIGPAIHAADLHALIQAIGGGPADVFASSGGAINALALAALYPRDVAMLVVHEPPIAGALPDAELAVEAVRAVHQTYETNGWGAGMAHFIALTGHRGEFTPEIVAQPAPDPQMFGMPGHDDGGRTDPLLGPSMLAMVGYVPDWEALRATNVRIVPAAGGASKGTMANRGAHVVAERLGIELVTFPGGHGGFVDSEWEHSDVAAFAEALRGALGDD